MLAADLAQSDAISPRIHPQIDVRAAGDLLMRAGFALPVVDTDTIQVRYSSLPQLITDLRAMGGTNLLHARSSVPLSRMALAVAYDAFASASEPDGKTIETFNIVQMLGWAPSPDQPQPAKRGSATQSLAESLRLKN